MGCNCGNKNRVIVPTTITDYRHKPKCENHENHENHKCKCENHENHNCSCVQSHEHTLVESIYTTTVCVSNTWIMPDVDDCVQLHLNNVENILPDAIMWNPNVGQLIVRSYDSTTGYVLACNNGEENNAEAGSSFPSNMCFHIGIPYECVIPTDYGVCLASDMIAPAEGEDTTIAVTTVSDIYIGDTVSIQGYMYKVVGITATTLTLRNTGDGAPEGTIIKNDPECTGKPCTVPIEVVNAVDACTNVPVNEGVMIVCNDGEKTTLVGTETGQHVSWDNLSQKWVLENDPCTEQTVTSGALLVCNSGTKTTLEGQSDGQLPIWDNTDKVWKIGTKELGRISGYKYGDGRMCFVKEYTSVNIHLEHSSGTTEKATKTAPLDSHLPSITIENPSDLPSEKPMIIIGTITVTIQGTFKSDTHTWKISSHVHKILATALGPGVSIAVTPKLNGDPIYGSGDGIPMESYRQDLLNLDPVADDAYETDPNTYSTSVTIPIVCEVTKGSNTISLTGTVTGYDLRNESHADVENKSVLNVKQIKTVVALAWIVKN